MSAAESKGTGVRDIAAAKFVAAYAAHLKKSGKVELPKWVDLVKTGTFQELAPYDQDWFFVRAASIARKIYLRGGIGIGRLKRIYGGSKRNNPSASHFRTGSGSVARHAVHALEKLGVIEKDKNGFVCSSLLSWARHILHMFLT
jgi:small subunit ribosomal protein S19e